MRPELRHLIDNRQNPVLLSLLPHTQQDREAEVENEPEILFADIEHVQRQAVE